MTDEWCEEGAGALLEAFHQQVPPRPERPQTFLEISGYPHYENVCSNILAFFFDPDKPHGLGTLFLDALVQIGCIKDPGTIGVDVQVDREEATSSGNRIDLLIRSHSHAIVIENKIFAGTDYNPLGDYAKHLCSLKQPNKCKFLLTLHPVRGDSDVGHGFTNITYADFVSKLRGLLGQYVAGADTRYLTIMLDFLNTLDHLREGVSMNQKLVDFLAKEEYSAEAQRFYKEIDSFRDELRKRVSDLAVHITVDAPSCNVKQRMFRGKSELADKLVHDIDHHEFEETIAVDTVVSPKGWRVDIFLRGRSADLGRREDLKRLLRGLDIKFDDGNRFTVVSNFDYGADLIEVAEFVTGVVNKLAGSGIAR